MVQVSSVLKNSILSFMSNHASRDLEFTLPSVKSLITTQMKNNRDSPYVRTNVGMITRDEGEVRKAQLVEVRVLIDD